MTLYSTVWSGRPADFEEDVRVLRRDQQRRQELFKTLWRCRDGDAVLLNGALGFEDRWLDLLLALTVRLRRRKVGLVISDATWYARSTREEARIGVLHRLVEVFGKLLLRLACGPHTHVCFLSRAEARNFAQHVGMPPERVHFTPFFPTLKAVEATQLLALRARTRQPFVFSGGNSSRDYHLLAEALGGAPYEVRVATRRRLAWPTNFTVAPEPHDRFLELMAVSAAVVVSLDTTTLRSVGQQTYLNAMLLGVPVVVNDAPGVRDHLEDGVHAVVVPARDPVALRRAVDQVLDPARAQEIEQRSARARAHAAALGPETYFGRLKDLLESAATGTQSTT